MKTPTVEVPAAILLDQRLSASAKLIWIFLRLGPDVHPAQSLAPNRGGRMTPALLQATSGLARHTVERALIHLRAAGWLSQSVPAGAVPEGRASLPVDLVLDRRVEPRAKLLYGMLQLTGGFRRTAGQCTYARAGALAGVSVNTVKRALGNLEHTGWLQLSQQSRYCPIHFTLRNPVTEQGNRAVVAAAKRLKRAQFKGEAIMREYLSMLVDSREYEDNATPGYLVNPYTGEEMQFDRYYPPDVAWEFNGSQHYGPTADYPDQTEFTKQQARDSIKEGICRSRAIQLIVLRPGDLTLEGIRQKATGLLPLRGLEGDALLVAYLESVSRGYRNQSG